MHSRRFNQLIFFCLIHPVFVTPGPFVQRSSVSRIPQYQLRVLISHRYCQKLRKSCPPGTRHLLATATQHSVIYGDGFPSTYNLAIK